MSINTVLFDLDGTLIDTNELIISSFIHTLDHYYPGQYSREDVLQFMGPPLYDTFVKMDKDRVQEMIDHYREYNLRVHDELVTEFDGVFDTVKALHDNGVKLGIVTTKMSPAVHMGLKLSKLDQFFDVIVALDHVEKAKPDPEPVLLALKQLDAKPEEALMVGDNYHDIESGKNAGTKTVAVSWTLKSIDFLKKYEPDYVIEHMSDLLPIVGVAKP